MSKVYEYALYYPSDGMIMEFVQSTSFAYAQEELQWAQDNAADMKSIGDIEEFEKFDGAYIVTRELPSLPELADEWLPLNEQS